MRPYRSAMFFMSLTGCGGEPLVMDDTPVEIPADALIPDDSGEPFWCEAHRQRNQYEQDFCPAVRPFLGYTDPRTGITFREEEWWNFYHWPDTCNRGSGGLIDETVFDESTLAMLEVLGARLEDLEPGIQCCYDVATDNLTDSGSFDFQSPPRLAELLIALPRAMEKLRLHTLLDVLTSRDVCRADGGPITTDRTLDPPFIWPGD